MLKLVQWAAPAIERVSAASTLGAPNALYERGRHFHLLTHEPGQERLDLPIWVSRPHTIEYNDSAAGPIVRTPVPGVQGAFVLSNVLSPAECDQINSVATAMGFTEDAPVSLGRRIRHNLSCVWLADESVWVPVWRRIASFMPSRINGGEPAGLNQRWRLYRYCEDDIFKLHTDGSWPGSKAREGPNGEGSGVVIRDAYGDRWSQMTLLLYLDESYEGGGTSFLVDGAGRPAASPAQPNALMRTVHVPKGGALCFFHGEHPLSLLHEGSLVTEGTKTIVRSDVLYMLDGAPLPPDDAARTQCSGSGSSSEATNLQEDL